MRVTAARREDAAMHDAVQAREEELHAAQEQGRALAAETGPNQGVYHPLLTPPLPASGLSASQKWPDNAAVDLRHIAR